MVGHSYVKISQVLEKSISMVELRLETTQILLTTQHHMMQSYLLCTGISTDTHAMLSLTHLALSQLLIGKMWMVHQVMKVMALTLKYGCCIKPHPPKSVKPYFNH